MNPPLREAELLEDDRLSKYTSVRSALSLRQSKILSNELSDSGFTLEVL